MLLLAGLACGLLSSEPVAGQPRFYQHLTPGEPERSAERIRNEGWSLRGYPALAMEPPVEWDADPHADANWRYQLNAMYPLAPAFVALERRYDETLHQHVRSLFRDWFDFHVSRDRSHAYRWHDMSTGIRAAYLAQLIYLEREHGSQSELSWMLEAAALHVAALADPAALASHNHAIYQLIGIAALCEVADLPTCPAATEYARSEFSRIFATQFNAEGMHLEHSPAYHGIAVRTFRKVQSSGLLPLTSEHDRWLQLAAENLQHLIHPDGGFAEIGDTEAHQARSAGRHDAKADWLISGGSRGEVPDRGARLFGETGLVSIRDGGEALDSFLYFTVAHHSRVHKHLDTGSFEWSDRGRRILIDSGKWGYDKTAEREYVVSAAAHNVVRTEGVELSPNDVPEERVQVTVRDFAGTYVIRAELPAPRRLVDGKHTRILVLRPGAWLLVADLLQELLPSAHTQWFQIGHEFEVEPQGAGYRFEVNGAGSMLALPLLDADSSVAARGESSALLGWYSPRYRQLVPGTQLGFMASGWQVELATLFRWVDGAEPVQAYPSGSTFDGDTLALCWHEPDGIQGVEINNVSGELSLTGCQGRVDA